MERVFREEAAGLVQMVATNVWLTLDLGGGTQVQRVYGYDYDLEGHTMRVQLDDVGAESNQILMINLVVPSTEDGERVLTHITFEYDDVFADMHDVQEPDIRFSYGAPTPYDPLVSPMVRRNVTILRMAEALQQVSYLCDQRKYEEALALVKDAKAAVWQVATEEGDEEMQEDVALLSNYETTLNKLVEISQAPPTPTVILGEQYNTGCCTAPLLALGVVMLVWGMMWLSRCG